MNVSGCLLGVFKSQDEIILIEYLLFCRLSQLLQYRIFDFDQGVFVSIHAHNNIVALLFDFGLLLNDHISQKLLLQTHESDGEVYHCQFNKDLREVVWVGHFCCHVKAEVFIIIVIDLISNLDLHNTALSLIGAFQQYWVQSWVQEFLNVLN